MSGVPIRLTDERWTHITEEHCEIAGLRMDVLEAVFNPSMIFEGKEGVLFAIREMDLKRMFPPIAEWEYGITY